MIVDTFISLYFFDQILLAEFLSKNYEEMSSIFLAFIAHTNEG